MKKIYFLVATLLLTTITIGQTVFINEIHYDNASTDVGEAVEIAGPAGTDLSLYSVIGYNGSNGEEYNSIGLSGIIPDQDNGYGTLFFPFVGMQNGSPDGLVLYDGSTVIQFLSYEGSFTAVGGVADGMTSIDIGVAESSSTLEGESLQLGGAGTEYSNFTWQDAMVNTMGGVNTNQDFGGVPQPGLSITYPSDGAVLNPEMTDLEVTFTVSNFVVASSGGDGHIHYTLDGGGVVMYYSTDPIALTGLSAGSHTFYMELVDNSHNPLDPPVNDTVTFEIASYTDVADLAALRAGTQGEYYRVTGEAVTTFTDGSKIWCQDATAGILIYDGNDNIATSYTEGDGITNLRGELTNFNDVLQLEPTADPGLNSSGNVVTPEVITLLDLTGTKALADYESELVEIHTVSITDISGGDGTFQANESYDIDDTTAASILRTAFTSADYIGTDLPSGPKDFVCIVGGYNGTAQVTPRDSGDILGVANQNIIEGFSMYPNPVTNGMIHITTQNNLEKNIQIFDVLGKLVYAETTNKLMLNISNLHKGIYIINIEEAGHFATRKLVVE